MAAHQPLRCSTVCPNSSAKSFHLDSLRSLFLYLVCFRSHTKSFSCSHSTILFSCSSDNVKFFLGILCLPLPLPLPEDWDWDWDWDSWVSVCSSSSTPSSASIASAATGLSSVSSIPKSEGSSPTSVTIVSILFLDLFTFLLFCRGGGLGVSERLSPSCC